MSAINRNSLVSKFATTEVLFTKYDTRPTPSNPQERITHCWGVGNDGSVVWAMHPSSWEQSLLQKNKTKTLSGVQRPSTTNAHKYSDLIFEGYTFSSSFGNRNWLGNETSRLLHRILEIMTHLRVLSSAHDWLPALCSSAAYWRQ